MPPTLLDTFRVLSSFSPARTSLGQAPWEEYVDWAIAQGLAPLAAYNLEYRLAGSDAPEWVRDRLLSIYQGTVNDNVMKLVSFKRAVTELEGRRVLLFGGASYVEALYPHVAFRPVPELRVLLRPQDLDGFVGFLKQSGFKPMSGSEGLEGAARAVTNDHVTLLLFTRIFGPGREAHEEAMVSRAMPLRIYGPSLFRPELEDALLLTVYEHAQSGYALPLIAFVDLREMLLGAPSLGGPYSRPPDVALVRARAKELRLERALYASLAISARLFPETASVAAAASPTLRAATRRLLDTLVVEPLATLGKLRQVRGADRLRRLLTGTSPGAIGERNP